jgi:protein-tyrosine-phosphatase
MQASQKESIQVEFPQVTNKTFLLSELAEGAQYDIPDPYESIDEIDHELAKEIFSLVKRGYKEISTVARRNEETL